MESREHIEDTAAAFIAKRGSSDWSDADNAELTGWLASSVSHRAAYYRLNAAWQEAGRLQALRAGNQARTFEEEGNAAQRVREFEVSARPAQRSYALAASVLLAVATGLAWYFWPTGPSYRTEVGGLAAVPLVDGSKITLNTDSRIRVAVSEAERRIDLERGEAYFEVAKDPTRPFVVQAGNNTITAVGTAFSVRRRENGSGDVIVAVIEGQVRLETHAANFSSRAGARGGLPRQGAAVGDDVIGAGTIARVKDDAVLVEENRTREIERALTWRNGQLTFRDTPLADAVAEFNRYNTRKIVIEDPTVAALEVGGIFRATNLDPFVRLLEEAFPIEVRETEDDIVLAAR